LPTGESFRRANLLYSLLYSLLYIPLYRKLLYKAENRCIRRYTSDTHCVKALHSYTATIQLYTIQLYSAIHYTTCTTPLWQSAPRVAPGGSESPLCRPNKVPTRPQTALAVVLVRCDVMKGE
jgi:hypothetical protein